MSCSSHGNGSRIRSESIQFVPETVRPIAWIRPNSAWPVFRDGTNGILARAALNNVATGS